MTDRDLEFLNALAADPCDETTRLVYADWLEEQGDTRAAYLRIEHELAQESPFNPRYWVLKSERNTYRANTDPRWLEAVGHPTYYTPLFASLPSDRIARWRLVDRFIDSWHRPLTKHSGSTANDVTDRGLELGLTIPRALSEWYQLAGGRTDIWSGQDSFDPLHQINVDPGTRTLLFRSENQGCEFWGVRLDSLVEEDPPVVRTEGVVESETVTAFAVQTLVFEAIIHHARIGGNTDNADAVRDWIESSLVRCDVATHYWVMDPVYFYESRDLLVMASPGDDFAYFAARTDEAMLSIPEEVRRHIELVSG